MVKVIGIDPGLAATGIGIVSGSGHRFNNYSFGSIQTSKELSPACRLHHIFSSITSLLTREQPDLMVVEDIFSLKVYPKSGILLGKVVGVIMLAAHQADLHVIEIAVREAKQVLTGNGNASKMQLEKAVRRQLAHNCPIRPYHASDALGLALIGMLRYHHLVGLP